MPAPKVTLDPADPEDLPGAWAVYRASTQPHDRDAARRPLDDTPDLPPPLYPHLLATSEGAFWVARRRGQVVGFAAAVSRGPLWFLSELWVAPDHRGQGTGSALLRMTRRASRGVRGRMLAGLAGADPAPLALGLRAGMTACRPVLLLEGDGGAVERLWKAHRPPRGARAVRYDPAAPLGPRSPLMTLDREARGGVRPQDHVFWMADGERSGFLLWQGKRVLAYVYGNRHGEIGPLAAAGPRGLLGALALGAREAVKGVATAKVRVPVAGGPALEALLAAGFLIRRHRLLMASGEFGRLDRYLPGDDSLF
jgi:GNAT superfamily N-acetyltransferase